MRRTTLSFLGTAALLGTAATGCGSSATGSVQIFIEGEDTIDNGLKPGAALENIKDGWTVSYDKFLITLGNFRASQSRQPAARLAEPRLFVIDMRAIPASGFQLAAFKDVEATRWDKVGYDQAIATAAAAKAPGLSQADYDLMVSGEYSIYVAGTIAKPDGKSCKPTAPTDCVPAPRITFAWGLPSATAADDCGPESGDSGFAIPSVGTAQVKLTIHGDHIFFSNMNLGVELVDRLAQWIADCDLDRDGATTLDELKMVQASDVFKAPAYNLSNAFGIAVRTAYDYAQTQERTIMHLQGEGDCKTPTVIQ
jgi:hypothetical protein